MAKSLLCGISPNCAAGRRTLPGRALQRAVNYFGMLPQLYSFKFWATNFLRLGGVKHIPTTLPSRHGHQTTVLCYMSIIAVMYMPHLHRLLSDPNLISSETLTFSPYRASRASLQLLDVPSSSFLLVLILEPFLPQENVQCDYNNNDKIHVHALGRIITIRFFLVILHLAAVQIKKKKRKEKKVSDRKWGSAKERA